ncbi:TRAP transporter small permease [Thalassospira sp. UBA1131]|uniref:TRAP transporter small permease n=1 Tax=Thalassospira sp. UBA1131 TaxID=1947672 RepID=UPI0025DE3D64|nr:TRAP transporter small permease subunit [Thalassospira sp. UBA1131]
MSPHNDMPNERAFGRALHRIDGLTWRLGGVFLWLSNICLLVMLGLTATTIIARPFGWSATWIWPWTMVFFVWLSFFGFFAIFVRQMDVRIEFLAHLLGKWGMIGTRLIANLCAIALCVTLCALMPQVIASARGYVEGAILPGFDEIPRISLYVPLFASAALIAVSALVDLAKMIMGIPERAPEIHMED